MIDCSTELSGYLYTICYDEDMEGVIWGNVRGRSSTRNSNLFEDDKSNFVRRIHELEMAALSATLNSLKG